MDASELHAQSLVVCEKVMQHPRWKAARTVLLYHALPDEVNTGALLRDNEKNILLPVVAGDELELRHYDGRLVEGAFGIMEPSAVMGDTVFSEYEKIDLVVVPGMAFDTSCHRLGRGKGYYDKLFQKIRERCTSLSLTSQNSSSTINGEPYKIGICFDFQLLGEVPSEEHDVLMDEVISV